ncbi:phosphoenolpyruvate--protein phosphotransferase [Polycladidibacter stylochi]|uniref:phosphoenolpyruvate--protein phosphotransferase n=1 Tax=Polycladidibacter stylochi TaxID=1807766 RepID=UPI00082E5DB5|nr:phosphoenolpyruvate--protein phosphotransferase [Pseudovibrio stylochi]
MVGIVVVSHSAQLAQGVAELAEQMTQGKGALAVCGGIDDPENPIGTDPVAVMGAIETVYRDSGVLVLMDLGSALMSTEMAIELLDPEWAANIEMCAAPLVEGTLAAAVAAASGLPLADVKAEAMAALAAKQKHLGTEKQESATEVQEDLASAEHSACGQQTASFNCMVLNHNGLHARPAASIVGALAPFSASVTIRMNGECANAKSLNAIAVLGVKRQDEITVEAIGVDAEQAIDAFRVLAEDGFGEDVTGEPAVANDLEEAKEVETQIDGAIAGLPASSGIAFGKAVFLSAEMPKIPQRESQGIDFEVNHYQTAVQSVLDGLKDNAAQAQAAKDKLKADIYAAHIAMLSDPELEPQIIAHVQEGAIAEAAWMQVMDALKEQYAQSASEYMRERVSDVLDITRQVMLSLTGESEQRIALEPDSILIAEDLSPSDTAKIDPEIVKGICLSGGGKTSHSAIIARAMGIPAIVRASNVMTQVQPGQEVILDGFAGNLWTDAPANIHAELTERCKAWVESTKATEEMAKEPAITTDGVHFPVQANIGGMQDVDAALKGGAEGVGLLRTEFLFQSRSDLPDEQMQYEEYKRIAAAFGDQPVTIRTLDVGGDKPLDSYPMAQEENPFLGHRGVRMCLSDPQLFKTQIRALIRAAAEQPNIQMMVPMIASLSELLAVKALVEVCREELNMPAKSVPMALGIMIEVPAAVLNADALAQEADFFSIGTNDLTQYVMAADRGNPQVAELVNYHEPAVIKAIELTCAAGMRAGIPVSMCGEMAGDTEVTQLLLHAGLSKLSASGKLLPKLKAKIRECESA